jgi:hypothetical protein
MAVKEMETQVSRLTDLFRSRLNSLKFAIAVWAIQAASLALWLVNYYMERAAFAETSSRMGIPSPIIERRPETFLFLIAGSVVNAAVLYYAYRKTSETFDDYQLRLEMANASPRLAESYSMANPLIYPVRGLFGRLMQWNFALVSVSNFFYALGFSWLFVLALQIFFFWYPIPTVGLDPVVLEMSMTFWIKRFVFYGINAVLFWILASWSTLNFLRTYRMYRLLEVRSEETERELAPKYGIPIPSERERA